MLISPINMQIYMYEDCGRMTIITYQDHRKLIGPSEVHATSGANIGRPLFFIFILLTLTTVQKIPEGVS